MQYSAKVHLFLLSCSAFQKYFLAILYLAKVTFAEPRSGMTHMHQCAQHLIRKPCTGILIINQIMSIYFSGSLTIAANCISLSKQLCWQMACWSFSSRLCQLTGLPPTPFLFPQPCTSCIFLIPLNLPRALGRCCIQRKDSFMFQEILNMPTKAQLAC